MNTTGSIIVPERLEQPNRSQGMPFNALGEKERSPGHWGRRLGLSNEANQNI